MSGLNTIALPRPQVGIERLPTQRQNNEPRESMNCKSCRKRKIKCNRLRPACEACQVFQCPCIYDAVPKKRGPKTDVLEALLKRVDGLEARLREKKDDESSAAQALATSSETELARSLVADVGEQEPQPPPAKRLAVDPSISPRGDATASLTPKTPVSKESPPPASPDALLDTYFAKFHARPYHILDEVTVRQRMRLNQLPNFLFRAIAAVSARYTIHPGGFQAGVKFSEECAAQARNELDVDEPSIDGLQALVLLVIAFAALGKGKKAYMLMTSAVGMAMALELHREVDAQARITPVERERRRHLFWTCYLLDRYLACGSKRPSLIADRAIMLRLPRWAPSPSAMAIDGEFFQPGSNIQFIQGTGKKSQGSTGMLIDITRILGTTNRYLAAGGVKGDSHFPWHSLSNLSKIRQDLDTWATGTNDVFSSVKALFSQADSTILVFSKLIYHLIHCLIYRPFLPIDLSELAGNGQHESWQIEATMLCFLHANAISELIELGRQASTIEWPAFVGYCICTAGTVHIHGAHYSNLGANGDMNVFSSSADFLSREMQQLSELRYAWASIQHQRETLQGIYNAHAELVKAVPGNTLRYTPGFHFDDFFDRYANIGGPGGPSFFFDAASLSLSDIVVDFTADAYTGHDLYVLQGVESTKQSSLKRASTESSTRPDLNELLGMEPHQSSRVGDRGYARRSLSYQAGMQNPSPSSLTTVNSVARHAENVEQADQVGALPDSFAASSGNNLSAATGFGMSMNNPVASPGQALRALMGTGLTPSYSFGGAHHATNYQGPVMNDAPSVYDPMFGSVPPHAFGSPSAWQGDDNSNQHHGGMKNGASGPAATSPGQRSNNGSTGTGHTDEKDPFLSLLEQLAENEQQIGNGPGSDLDFFLAGTGHVP